jgi:hypothetical protein
MRHTVRLKTVVVGHSDLEHVDVATGRAWGEFRPGLGYELVQPVFRLFARANPRDGTPGDDALLGRYHRARATLGLELYDDEGRAIPESIIHIADYSIKEGSSAITLDVLISDPTYWTRRSAK